VSGSRSTEWQVEKMTADLIRYSAAVNDLVPLAKMAADGTYIPKDHARAVLEKHGLAPKEQAA
jgi:hypothetical protein